MNCLEFERLLDSGALAALSATALEHARDCAGCTRSLARARSLEHHLERAFSAERGAPVTGTAAGDALPATFTAVVMARVARGEARGVRWLAPPDLMPWWVRVAAEPGVALACVVAALLLWKGDALLAGARSAWPAWSASARIGVPAGFTAVVQPIVQVFVPAPDAPWTATLAMLVALAPLFGLAGWALWHASERLASGSGLPVAR